MLVGGEKNQGRQRHWAEPGFEFPESCCIRPLFPSFGYLSPNGWRMSWGLWEEPGMLLRHETSRGVVRCAIACEIYEAFRRLGRLLTEVALLAARVSVTREGC